MQPNCKCRACGANFYTQPGRIASGRGHFCSRACADAPIGLAARFWPKVLCDIATRCWLWTGGTDQDGYGTITRGRWGEGSMRATHASLLLAGQPLSAGLWALHNCPQGDNPSCVNSDHLFAGTPKANMDDMWAKGRARPGNPNPVRGERQHSAKLTDAKVREIRRLYSEGSPITKIGRVYSVTASNVWAIVTRKTWVHVD